MKIAFDLTSLAFNFSGIERYALNISKSMIEKSPQDTFCLLFCNEVHKDYKDICLKDNVEYRIVRSGGSKLSKLYMFQVKNICALKKFKADIYIFLAFAPPILFRSRNTVTTIHDIGYFDCPRMWKWYVTLYGKIKIYSAIKHSSKLVAVSNFTKDRIIDKFGYNKNIDVIYNAIEDRFKTKSLSITRINHVRQKYSLPNGEFLLCLSTLEPRKNLQLLIKSYVELKQENKITYDLVIAGRKGWKIDNLLNNVGDTILKTIHFTGFIDDTDLPTVYQLADLFIFPSTYEGFGIPPLEAMGCGTQPIVSDIAIFREILNGGAVYFTNNDSESLKEKILAGKKIPYEILISQAQKYSWEISAIKYREVIEFK